MQHPKMKYLYCGVDTHKQTHTATIINCFNDKLAEITVVNKLAGFKKLEEMVNKPLQKGLKLPMVLKIQDTQENILLSFFLKKIVL